MKERINLRNKILLYIFLMLCLYSADSGVRQYKNFKQVALWKADFNHSGKEITFDRLDTLLMERVDVYLDGEVVANVDYNCLTLLY